MIEIVFNESAGGCLKAAQHFGKGEYRPHSAFALLRSDGRKASKKELEQARHEFEEKEKAAWERAVPLGGTAADVFSFELGLSIGDISEKQPGVQRRRALELLYPLSCIPGEEDCLSRMLQHASENLNDVLRRVQSGESLRIWYSHSPEELCGLYWLMEQFARSEACPDSLSLVKLPDWDIQDDGTVLSLMSWGEISPEKWHRYLCFQRQADKALILFCAAHWNRLREENAPLRAILNGRLVSVPESFYDTFLLREIEKEETFLESRLIGKILTEYRLAIPDGLLHARIDSMLGEGSLELIKEHPEIHPYQRTFRRLRGRSGCRLRE